MRHLIMPEIFRLLYCCSMRISEVLRLSVADVDLDNGILTIRNAKFNKDRLLPLPKSMTVRLQQYAVVLGEPAPEAMFFPAPDNGPYSTVTVYAVFRHLLRKCGIPHRGRGKGPRLHELRHAFFRYLQTEDPDRILKCQQILAIPLQRIATPPLALSISPGRA